MRSAVGQGTVEYVGVLLLVAVLVAAIAGGFGVPRLTAGIASSITRALLGAIGVTDAGPGGASASERAAFARATDAAIPDDDRRSLRDVRLALIAAHGDEHGRAIYRELVVDNLKRVVPGLAGPTAFATASRELFPHARAIIHKVIQARSLGPPTLADPGEIETPIGPPNAHVVTVAEADTAALAALHKSFDWENLALDSAGIVPFAGVLVRLRRVAVVAQKVGTLANEASGVVAAAEDTQPFLTPSEAALPPGAREGDELVSWIASRRAVGGGAARLFARAAVVRGGVVIGQGIQVLPARTSTPEGHA